MFFLSHGHEGFGDSLQIAFLTLTMVMACNENDDEDDNPDDNDDLHDEEQEEFVSPALKGKVALSLSDCPFFKLTK